MDEFLRGQARRDAAAALAEDVGGGDLSAPLIPDVEGRARLFCRERAVLCGVAWFEECFLQLGEADFVWYAGDGDWLAGDGMAVCEVAGGARGMLAAERSALNFLQTLSGTATMARRLREVAANVVDTRKTLPLLRRAQKYAVRVGGLGNHRVGLFDEILVKENHLCAAGGDVKAVLARAAELAPMARVQVEVRSLGQLEEVVRAGARRVLLDNFSIEELRRAVEGYGGTVELEASGGVDEKTLAAVAGTGVARVSVGALTKHVRAVDFSLQFVE